jgi:VWFA-related protein
MKPAFRFSAAIALGVAAALSANAAQGPDSQSPPIPTFRAEAEYVDVDVLVTDAEGRFVNDLRREDFQIFEDGKPQKLANFALVEIPRDSDVPSSSVGRIDPDVMTNERPFIGRVYVLILDDLHTAPLRAPLVKRAASQFIERYLGANDLMAVVYTRGREDAPQDFTSNKRLLLAAVERFSGTKIESATMARNHEFYRGGYSGTGAIDDPYEFERGFNARSAAQSLRQVAEWLGGIQGRRKTILFVSEGIDYDITDLVNNRSATGIFDEMRMAVAAATRSNVSIYTVDPRGLSAVADEAIETGQFADQRPRTASDDPDASSAAQRRLGIGLGSLRSETQLAQDSLRTLAEETNGFAAVNANDFTSAFERIVNDNSTYYLLAYYPPSSRRDGRFHRIEVRTTRPGLRVRARRGYVAPRSNTSVSRIERINGVSSRVLAALNSPLPTSGLGLRVFAAPFKGPVPNASVVIGVELSGRQLSLTGNNRVEFSWAIVDASGRTRTSDTDTLTLRLPQDIRERVAKSGIRLLERVSLPPGRYQFRVAGQDVTSGAVGGLSYDLEVPDYEKQPLSMSGLLLTSTAGSATMTARGDVELQRILPGPPMSLRTFPPDDELMLFAEVYDGVKSAPHAVDITTTVRASDGQVVFEHNDERSSAELQGSRGGYGHTVTVPMSGLAPGRYLLTVEARSRLGPAASRHTQFDVTAQ